MNRSAMRENAFKLVYSLEIQQEENLEEQIDLFFESNSITDEETKKYIKEDKIVLIWYNKIVLQKSKK